MTSIQQISRLKHPGVIRDFTWSTELNQFGQFNLIYGWNGSGKTTLSRLFRNLEHRSVPNSGQARLCIDDREINGRDFPDVTTQVRVFNRDFVNESVFPVGGGDVPPIFVLGTDSVDKQKTVNLLLKKQSDLNNKLDLARTNQRNTSRELEKHIVDRAKIIKDTLRISGSGAYNEYNKSAYRRQADQMLKDGDAESHLLDDATRSTLLYQHAATVKSLVSEVEYKLPDLEHFLEDVATIRATTVVSSMIHELENDPQLSTWTHEGLRLHKDRDSQTCLYCQQTLPSKRQEALEAHFSAGYERFLTRIDELLKNLDAINSGLDSASTPDKTAFYDDIAEDYVTTKSEYEQALTDLKKTTGLLTRKLKEKREHPFKHLETDVSLPQIDYQVINRLNEIIRRHNEVTAGFQTRIKSARERLAKGMIASYSKEYRELKNAIRNAYESIEPIEAEQVRITEEIVQLEREIVQHRQPAEELNDDLRNYLGHDEFSLGVKETGYEFVRHGEPADSLSEGERTALALLYFLKSLDDRNFDLNNGVIVLDDPVSSLDENSIFLAFGYIRQRTQDAAQLFVLTHNFTFFRLVRNWFNHLPGQGRSQVDRRPARFYMLERVFDSETRCTTIRPLDPLLELYESEYHYLFARVYRESSIAVGATLEHLFDLPNVARRLLESFLAFRRPQVSGDLWKKIQDSDFDQNRSTRIIRFVHTHSHGDGISEPEHDLSLLGEARSVLDDVLAFIEYEDSGHYKAMIEVIT